MLYARLNAANVVDDVVAQARRAHEIGVRQVWLAAAVRRRRDRAGGIDRRRRAPDLAMVRQQADQLTPSAARGVVRAAAQAASHGSFSRGLGLGAHEPERQAFGVAWLNTIRRLREHLTVLAWSSTPAPPTFTARSSPRTPRSR